MITIKKKNLIIILVLLIFLLSIYYFYNLESNNKQTINYNNSDNIKLNNTSNKNISLYNNSTAENHDTYKNKSNNGNNEKNPNDDYDEALMAKKMVEKYALNKNEIAKYPTFKDRGMWLIPIFDKNTGKFTGSVFADDQGSIFINGPDTYSEYKKLVHGKKVKHNSKDPIKKSKSSKSNKQTKNNKSKINKSKTNKKTTNNSFSYTSKLNQHIPSIESNKTN